MLRTFSVIALGALITTASGCAGHKELKAPCAPDKTVGIFSSVAFAADPECGPLIRQDGVSIF